MDQQSLVSQVETVRTMAEETRVEGNVSSHIYLKYFTAGCNRLVLLVIVLLSVTAEVSHCQHLTFKSSYPLFHLFSSGVSHS